MGFVTHAVGKAIPGFLDPIKAASPLGPISSLLPKSTQKAIDPLGAEAEKVIASQDDTTQKLLTPFSGGAKKTLLVQ